MTARRIALAALLLCAAIAGAEEDPNVERGVKASKSYSFGGVDNVNVFNGNVNLRIPLGLTYRVGGTMSYSLGATYATNSWEMANTLNEVCRQTPDLNYCKEVPAAFSHPARHTNAGFGWIVSLGKMEVSNNAGDGGTYHSPDGGQYRFYKTLHPNNPAETEYLGGSGPVSAGYTRDGSYLRMREYSSPRTFEVDFPNGHVHKFDALGRLTEMVDPYGNWARVDYSTRGSGAYATSSKWRIHDVTDREHFVYFRPTWSYMHDTVNDNGNLPTPPPGPFEMVDYVELAAPPASNGTARKAVYQFVYNSSPDTFAVALSRRSVQQTKWDDYTAKYVFASMLTSIQIPEGLAWTMTYDMGDGVQTSHVPNGGASGNITRLTMPGGGRIDWMYRWYDFPAEPQMDSNLQSWVWNAGIATKKVFNDANDVNGATLIEETEYQPEDLDTSYPEEYQGRLVLHKNNGSVVNAERHYFSTCMVGACSNRGEYGLPLARFTPNGSTAAPPFISNELLEPTSNGFVVRRSTYVEYEMDGNVSNPAGRELNLNRRLKRTRTVFEDGTISETSYSRFDGFGNYRKTSTGGTFPGENVRHVEVETNPGKPDFTSMQQVHSRRSPGCCHRCRTPGFSTASTRRPSPRRCRINRGRPSHP